MASQGTQNSLRAFADKAGWDDTRISFADNITARITLVSVKGDAPLPERNLILHPDNLTIQIGRASKSPSKGLQAAVDNAWFDSPVMSRNHAEIFMDTDSVFVKDIGSMHGTFINQCQLVHNEPSRLKNGDILVLGAEVKRNSDIFPACVFRVNFEIISFKTTPSYAFPESDEEEYENSEDDMDHIDEPSSEDGVSIESPPHKVSQPFEAIDLTRDESPVTSSVAGFGCTLRVQAENNLTSTAAGRSVNVHPTEHQSRPMYKADRLILIDSDDEDAHFSSDSDSQCDEIEYGGGASSGEESFGDLKDSDNQDDMDAPIHAPSIRTIVDLFEDGEDEEDVARGVDGDEGSEFGLSEAGDEGIRVLFDDEAADYDREDELWKDGHKDVENDSGLVYKPFEVAPENPLTDERLEAPKHVTFASFDSAKFSETAFKSAPFNNYQRTFGDLHIPKVSASVRQPSPSDAAMVKTVKPSATVINQTSAQSLGDKAGKHTFFAAREENKANIQSFENARPLSWDRDTIHQEPTKQRKLRDRQFAEEENTNKLEAATLPLLATIPYLDDPSQVPRAIRTANPEFDMTSAVTFNESKALIAAGNKHATGRSALKINDIIERAAGDQSASSLKRKADDISEAIENEVRVWASSSAELNTTVTAAGTSAALPTVGEEPSKTIAAPITHEHRPAKRLRKIVESVGYVALGGATLFGALVLSAPDFL